jgi:hypothetical protein
VQRHGSGRQVRPSGSTPHDLTTGSQIGSSRSLALDRPPRSAPGYSSVVDNRPKIYRIQRHPPLIHQPLHRRTSCWIGSIQIRQFACGTQIPIAPAAPPYVPLSAVSSLGGFRTPTLGARGISTHWAGIRNPSQKLPLAGSKSNFRFALESRLDSAIAACPKRAAGSTGRGNTGVKSLCWGFKLQGLTWSFVYP